VDAVIEVDGLRKTYPDGTEAVKGIGFAVARGEFFGFLGPNGAGKSTTIKILITLLARSGGEARVLGRDVDREADAIRRSIGYAAQEVGVDDDLTGRENLTLQGRLYHLPPDVLRQRVDELLELMDLAGDADRPAGAYSGGMRKRLDLATGLIHRPQVLFLDEPTTGLDPQNRANLWRYLERLNREGLTIFLTTHYMEEADRLCDRLAIIDHGQIIALGRPADLKAQLGGDVIALTFNPDGAGVEQQSERAGELLGGLPFVRDIVRGEEGVNVIVQDAGAAVPQVMRALDDAGIAISRLSLTSPTLDDVFIKLTGSTIRGEELNANWRNMRGPWGRGGPGGRRRRR
jgi:ABC-2 type transport system ATP-binding protein